MDPLTTIPVFFPLNTEENARRSLETRVLNPQIQPWTEWLRRSTLPSPDLARIVGEKTAAHITQSYRNLHNRQLRAEKAKRGGPKTLTSSGILPNSFSPKYLSPDLPAKLARFIEKKILKYLPEKLVPMDFEEWVQRYPQHRQSELRKARTLRLNQGKLSRTLKCFLKMEPTPNFTDPRNICTLDDTVASIIGPWWSPVDHWISTLPYAVKGKDPNARTRKMLARIKGMAAVVEGDISRMDKHVHYWFLSYFDAFIIAALYAEPEITQETLDDVNFRAYIHGMRAERLASQFSGKNNTAAMQTLRNYFMLWACLEDKADIRKQYTIHVEGDDSHIACKTLAVAEKVKDYLGDTQCFGFPVKIIVREDPDLAYFCGRYMDVETETSIADGPRACAKFHLQKNGMKPEHYLFAKAAASLALDADTPCIGPMARAVYNATKLDLRKGGKSRAQALHTFKSVLRGSYQTRKLLDQSSVNKVMMKVKDIASRPPKISANARAIYDKCGINLPEQLLFEHQFGEDFTLPDRIEPIYHFAPPAPSHVLADIGGNGISF